MERFLEISSAARMNLAGHARPDTMGCMAGAIAEAFYGVPEELKEECEKRLPDDIRYILAEFAERVM